MSVVNHKVEFSPKKRGVKPGTPRNPNSGRKKGTLNKKTIFLQQELENVGLSWGEEFKKALVEKDYKRAEILTGLLPYLNPRLKESEAPVPVEEKPTSPSDNNILSIIADDKK